MDTTTKLLDVARRMRAALEAETADALLAMFAGQGVALGELAAHHDKEGRAAHRHVRDYCARWRGPGASRAAESARAPGFIGFGGERLEGKPRLRRRRAALVDWGGAAELRGRLCKALLDTEARLAPANPRPAKSKRAAPAVDDAEPTGRAADVLAALPASDAVPLKSNRELMQRLARAKAGNWSERTIARDLGSLRKQGLAAPDKLRRL